MKQDCNRILNLVTLTFAIGSSLQEAIDQAFSWLVKTVKDFERSVMELEARHYHVSESSISPEEARLIVQAFQDLWVGTVYWQ
jgi:hypothetical protein